MHVEADGAAGARRRPPAAPGRDRARRRPARPGRHRAVPAAAGGRRLDAGAVRDRPRRRGRPRARPGARRRRLRDQAVLAARAGRPGQDGAAARPAASSGRPPLLRSAAVSLDPDRRRAYVDGRPRSCSPPPSSTCSPTCSAGPAGCTTREHLLSEVWGYAAAAGTRTVDVHVAQLRAKLGDASPIRTVRGVGYCGGVPVTGPPRRQTLATRIALVTTAVAVVAVLVAGLVVAEPGEPGRRRRRPPDAVRAGRRRGRAAPAAPAGSATDRSPAGSAPATSSSAARSTSPSSPGPARPAAARPTGWPAGR